MTKIYITSDCHYFHKNILRYCNRPFKDVDEMNEELIRQHNKIVKPDDIVYNLGDFTFGSAYQAVSIVKRLNGQHRFVCGNHDKWLFDSSYNSNNAYREIQDELLRVGAPKEKIEWIKDYYEFKHNGTLFCLMHFPLFTWHHSYKGSINLYGHCHASIEHMIKGRQMDVGVDNAFKLTGEYRPFSLEEVARMLLKRDIVCPEMKDVMNDPWDKTDNNS